MSDDHLIHHELERQSNRRPDQPAFVFEGREYSYAAFDERTRRVAAALDERGLGPGDVVLAHARNHVDLYTLYYACSRLGCVYSPVSTHQSAGNAKYILETIDPTVVCYTADEAITDGLLPTIRSNASVDAAYSLDDRSVGSDETLPDVLADVDPRPVERDIDGTTHHSVFWTSGTTGRPKAAVRNHTDSLNFAKPLLETFPFESNRTRLLPRDMMYVAPYLQYGLPGLMNGETNLILRDLSAEAIVDAIQEHDVYVTSVGFTLGSQVLDRMRERGVSARVDKSHTVLQSREVAKRLQEALVDELYHIYATTEVGLPLVGQFDEDGPDPPTLGPARAGTTVRVVTADPEEHVPPTEEVERGEAGELIVRGMTTLTRYLRDETQAEHVHDGFVYTGDLVRQREDGEFQFVGRVDNRLRSGGVNVYPENIERVLENHGDVDVAVVVGVPDEKWGDRICAVVVPDRDVDGSALAERLEEHCLSSEDVSRQMRPKEYRVVESIDDVPTGALGKYDRSAIAALFEE